MTERDGKACRGRCHGWPERLALLLLLLLAGFWCLEDPRLGLPVLLLSLFLLVRDWQTRRKALPRIDVLAATAPTHSTRQTAVPASAGVADDTPNPVLPAALQLERLEFLAHDLRSPLASLLSLVDALRLDAGPETLKKRLDQMEASAEKALHVAAQMFQLLRVESLPDIRRDPLDLLALVEAALDTVETEARRADVTLALRHDAPATLWTQGQGELLELALVNLLGNAVKYSHAGDKVEVGVRGADGQLRVTVRDAGVGMTVADQERLLKHYGRLKDAPPGLAGAGLGVHFVQTVAVRHGGRLEVTSALGQGSCFTLFLPAAPPVS